MNTASPEYIKHTETLLDAHFNIISVVSSVGLRKNQPFIQVLTLPGAHAVFMPYHLNRNYEQPRGEKMFTSAAAFRI